MSNLRPPKSKGFRIYLWHTQFYTQLSLVELFHFEISLILLKINMPLPWHFEVYIKDKQYRFHDPQCASLILLILFELLKKDHVLARHEEGGGQKIVLIRLLDIALLIQTSFKLLQILTKRILPTQLIPAPKMINLSLREESMFLKNPVNLLLLTPHNIPIISLHFSPFPSHQAFVHAVPERCLEFYGRSVSKAQVRSCGVVLFLYVFSKVL